jgi:hypothetical protein
MDPSRLDLDEVFKPLLAIIEQARARAYRVLAAALFDVLPGAHLADDAVIPLPEHAHHPNTTSATPPATAHPRPECGFVIPAAAERPRFGPRPGRGWRRDGRGPQARGAGQAIRGGDPRTPQRQDRDHRADNQVGPPVLGVSPPLPRLTDFRLGLRMSLPAGARPPFKLGRQRPASG